MTLSALSSLAWEIGSFRIANGHSQPWGKSDLVGLQLGIPRQFGRELQDHNNGHNHCYVQIKQPYLERVLKSTSSRNLFGDISAWNFSLMRTVIALDIFTNNKLNQASLCILLILVLQSFHWTYTHLCLCFLSYNHMIAELLNLRPTSINQCMHFKATKASRHKELLCCEIYTITFWHWQTWFKVPSLKGYANLDI